MSSSQTDNRIAYDSIIPLASGFDLGSDGFRFQDAYLSNDLILLNTGAITIENFTGTPVQVLTLNTDDQFVLTDTPHVPSGTYYSSIDNTGGSSVALIRSNASDNIQIGDADHTLIEFLVAGSSEMHIEAGALVPGGASKDLGTAGVHFDTLFVDNIVGVSVGLGAIANDTFIQWDNALTSALINVIKVDGNDDTILNAVTGKDLLLQTAEITRWRVDGTDFHLVGHDSSNVVRNNTNSQIMEFAGGVTTGGGDGPRLSLQGNDFGGITNGGLAELFGGDEIGGHVRLGINNATAQLQFFNTSGIIWSMNNTGHLISNATFPTIRTDTTDGSDTKDLTITGGGEIGAGRGGQIILSGNENANPGRVRIDGGSGGGGIEFAGNGGGAADWSVTAGGVLLGHNASMDIIADTLDGFDTSKLRLAGGGGAGNNRGAVITLAGNENGATGDIEIFAGDNGGTITFVTGNDLIWKFDDENFVGLLASNLIRTNAVTSALTFAGGITAEITSGAFIELKANDNGGANLGGAATIFGGNEATSDIRLALGNAAAEVQILDASSATLWSFAEGGSLTSDATDGGSLFFNKDKTGVVNNVTNSVVAAGTTQGTATLLPSIVNLVVSVTDTSAEGVILDAALISSGQMMFVANKDTSAGGTLKVYPPSGGEIDLLGTNIPLTLEVGESAVIYRVATTTWMAVKTGTGSGVNGDFTRATVQTTDATTTTLGTFTLGADETHAFVVTVSGRGPSDKNIVSHIRGAVRKTAAGSATIFDSIVSDTLVENAPGYTVAMDTSGNDLRVRVTGAVAETVDWISKIMVSD